MRCSERIGRPQALESYRPGHWHEICICSLIVLRSAKSRLMKLITAVIRPFKLDDVRKAIADIGIQGITVTEVQGFRANSSREEFQPNAKIELAVDDSIAEQVVEAVCNVARTGRSGDGKLWVADLEQALRVRTGETGVEAI